MSSYQLSVVGCRKKWLTAAAVLVLCLATISAVRADDADLYAKTLPATGWIYVPGCGDGTCWVVDREQRLVITNKHVVSDKDDAEIMFPMFKDGQLVTAANEYLQRSSTLIIKGKVIARDAKRDLAIVQLEKLPATVGVLVLAKSSAQDNDAVLSIGNSGLAGKPIEQGSLWKMRTGKVVHKSFRIINYRAVGQKVESSTLNSSLKTSPGDSGGPVVNQNGELVGVTSGGNSLDSFAIDVIEVQDFLTTTIEKGRRPIGSGPVLTGKWTQSWINGAGHEMFVGLTLRPDGTMLFEEENGGTFEGTFSVDAGRLTLAVPALATQLTCDMDWINYDSFRLSKDGVQYTMQRR